MTSLVAQTVKLLPIMQGTWVQSLGQEDSLEKEMATPSSTLAWKIPWTEEPGRLLFLKPQLFSTSEENPESWCWLPRPPVLWPLFSSWLTFSLGHSDSLLFPTSQTPCARVPSLHRVIFLRIFVTLCSLSFLFIWKAKKSPLATLFK